MIDNEIQKYSTLDLPDNYEADEGVDLHDDIYLPLLCHSLEHDRFTYGFSNNCVKNCGYANVIRNFNCRNIDIL